METVGDTGIPLCVWVSDVTQNNYVGVGEEGMAGGRERGGGRGRERERFGCVCMYMYALCVCFWWRRYVVLWMHVCCAYTCNSVPQYHSLFPYHISPLAL